MWVYVDESGHPHPNDSSEKAVLVAVCLDESFNRQITIQLHNLKRDLLGKEDYEIKANKLLRPSTFLQVATKRELSEAVFDLFANLPLRIFAVVMPRPKQLPMYELGHLPIQYVHLLQRIELFMQPRSDKAMMIFDDGGPTGVWKAPRPGHEHLEHKSAALLLSTAFTNFLFRHPRGREFVKIHEVPFFVSSQIVPGLQIADMMAGCIRLYEQRRLYETTRIINPFDSAIRRFYRVLEGKKEDLIDEEGNTIWAFYSMSERALLAESIDTQVMSEEPGSK